VRSRMSQTHQLRFRELPCEIVEIETLRLTLFIKRDHQISNGLSFQSISLGVAKLFPLCFTLRLLSPLLLPCPLFLSFREGCTRGSCHMGKNVRFRLYGYGFIIMVAVSTPHGVDDQRLNSSAEADRSSWFIASSLR